MSFGVRSTVRLALIRSSVIIARDAEGRDSDNMCAEYVAPHYELADYWNILNLIK